MTPHEFIGEGVDARQIAEIERKVRHAGVLVRDGLEGIAATPGDDYLVARPVEGAGETRPDATTATGDQDCVARQLHVPQDCSAGVDQPFTDQR